MDAVHPVHQLFRFGLFEANSAHNTLTRNGVRVKIQDQPFRVLLMLLQRPGEIVTREELRQKLWPDGTFVDFDGSLNVTLKKLRAAIDDDSDNPCFVETIPRRGYRFIAPVSVTNTGAAAAGAVDARAQDGNGAEAAEISLTSTKPSLRRPIYLALSISTFVVVGVLVTAQISWYRRAEEANRLTLSAHASAVSLRKSVAVLGFQNVTGKAEDAWLATAFSEMLSTELAAGGALRLASGEEVANLHRAAPWPQPDTLDHATSARVGNALNSDVLVFGSYATVGNPNRGQLRLDVRMQDAKTGEVLTEFAEAGDSENLFQIISLVGGRLRNHLGVARLDPPVEAGVLASSPNDRDAARFYALGIARLREFDLIGARDLLQQACNADPKFSLAHLMLGRAWGGLGYAQKHKEETKKAYDLSADLPRTERMLVEGDYYESVSDHERAASTYSALFALFPDSVDYGLMLVNARNSAGHRSQASQTVAQLRRLPPPASDDPRIDIADMWATANNDPDRLVLIQSAIRKASQQGKKLIYAQARRDECLNLIYSEHPEQGLPACEDAYNVFLSMGNRAGAADAVRLEGDLEGRKHPEQAIVTYEKALKILQGLGEDYKTGAVLNNMAINYENEGKLDHAELLFRQAKSHFEQVGDKVNTSTALGNIGDIAYLKGDLPRAARSYEESLEIESSVDGRVPAYNLYRLGDVELIQGHVQEARQHAEHAIENMRLNHGAYGYLAQAMGTLGKVLKEQGDLEGARHQFQAAFDIQKNVGETAGLEESQEALADMAIEDGHPEQAEPLLRSAIAEFEKEKEDPDATSAYTLLSTALLKQGKLDEARQAIAHAEELARTSPDPNLKLPIAIQTGRVALAEAGSSEKGHTAVAKALERLRAAAATAKKLGYYNLECEARIAIGEIEMRLDPATGRAQLTQLASEAHSHGLELYATQARHSLATGGALLTSGKSTH